MNNIYNLHMQHVSQVIMFINMLNKDKELCKLPLSYNKQIFMRICPYKSNFQIFSDMSFFLQVKKGVILTLPTFTCSEII